MLGLLDLRERGDRLEPTGFEPDLTVTETIGEASGHAAAIHARKARG